MAEAFVDRITTLSLVERNGVIRSMTRVVRVIFTPADLTGFRNFTILSAALAVLDALTPPISVFSTLSQLGYDALVLVERSPTLSENDTSCVDVTLKYEHILDGPNQGLLPPPGTPFTPPPPVSPPIYGKGRASITEKTTNFYIPPGKSKTLANRVQILVAHTFPTSDTGVVGQCIDPRFPWTIVQGGEVTVPYPQENYQFQGVLNTDNPWNIVDRIIARINSKNFLNKPPQTWICSEIQFDVLSPDHDFYRFSFEFQYNQDTWNPTVVFNDQRTGRPPASVEKATIPDDNGVLNQVANLYSIPGLAPIVQPAGYWNVPVLDIIDFNETFRAIFEGAVFPGGA